MRLMLGLLLLPPSLFGRNIEFVRASETSNAKVIAAIIIGLTMIVLSPLTSLGPFASVWHLTFVGTLLPSQTGCNHPNNSQSGMCFEHA